MRTLERTENPCPCAALIVVDAQARVFAYWDHAAGREAKEMLCEADGASLRAWLQALVRSLVDDARSPGFTSCTLLRDGGKTLRMVPLAGSGGEHFGLVMEADADGCAIVRAASRFQLTQRQTEVLELVLGGASASDVARSLVISEYTAQGYVKTLLAKTKSRNRAAMVAKVLDWKLAFTPTGL